jgi:hypothetical protein
MKLLAKGALDWLQRMQALTNLFLGVGGASATRAALKAYGKVPSIWVLPISCFVAVILIVLASRLLTVWAVRNLESQLGTAQLAGTAGTSNPSSVDLRGFVAGAHRSPLAEECESNVRTALNSVLPDDRYDLLIRFAAVGIVSYVHDETWWAIFRSQIQALEALNLRPMRLEDVRTEFYDLAAGSYPEHYSHYRFESWLTFMEGRILILSLPAETLGITRQGKDFLSYLVHHGRSASQRQY